jgi:trigger factor
MQIAETLNAGLKRGVTITVTAAELEAKVHEKLVEAQPDIEMKGFRKGRVPLPILKKQFGPRILGDAMQDAIDGAMKAHFDRTGDRPALQPEMKMLGGESWAEGQDVVVEMTYEALPAIPEIDLGAIALDRLVVAADDAAVAEALANLAENAKDFEDRAAGAAAETGDQVVIDFKGAIDGTPFEGGAAEDYPLVLGSGSFIPGFEEQLAGAKAGDELAVKVSFPDSYGAKHLAGREAVFACTVKAVKAPRPAAIDDALAKRFGADDLAALRSQIAERLEAEYNGAARAVLKRALLDRLDALVSFDLPARLVDAEADQIAHQLWHEENPEHRGHDHGAIAPTDEHRALADRRVRLGLLLAEIGRKAEVKVTDAEMTQAVIQAARQYPGQERQFFEFVQKNQGMQQQLRAPVFEDKVVDHILATARVTDREATRADLQAAVDALDKM